MDDGASPVAGLLVFFLLAIINFCLYGFGAAVQNLNESELKKRAEGGEERAAKLQQIVEFPKTFIGVVQMAATGIGLVLGIYEIRIWVRLIQNRAGNSLNALLGEQAAGAVEVLVVFLLVWYLQLSLCILAPKIIGAHRSKKFADSLVGMICVLLKICYPFIFLATRTAHIFARLFGVDPYEDLEDVTEEEILSMVNEGHEQGVIQASEAEMISNIFEFDDKEAKDIMTHRKNMVAVDGNLRFCEVVDFLQKQPYSRFPVYEGDLENVTGIIHLRDVLMAYTNPNHIQKKLKEIPHLVREVTFIPETRNVSDLFKAMQSQKIHMVIVVDEYGQTAGLVALEDILEEIVGNIFDEYDEEEQFIIPLEGGKYIMNGLAPLHEVGEALGIRLEDEFETLNGFLISKIDKIPQEGERYEVHYGGYGFFVLNVMDKMIRTVKILPEPSKEETGCQVEKTEKNAKKKIGLE